MKIDTATILNILTPNNKAIAKMVDDGLLKSLDANSANQTMQSLLDELFGGFVKGDKTANQIESLLKNPKLFNSLGSFGDNLKSLIQNLKDHFISSDKIGILNNLFEKVDGLDDKKLKEFFKDSGLFLESKLLKNEKNIHNDIKAILLGLQNETNHNEIVAKDVEKLLTQIDYYQLLSVASQTNWMYLPLNWEEFENGKIGFKTKADKSVYCEIDLMLKKYEQLKVKLFMQDEDYLNIVFESNNEAFFSDASSFLNELKLALHKIGFVVSIDFKNINDELSKKFESGDYFDSEISINV